MISRRALLALPFAWPLQGFRRLPEAKWGIGSRCCGGQVLILYETLYEDTVVGTSVVWQAPLKHVDQSSYWQGTYKEAVRFGKMYDERAGRGWKCFVFSIQRKYWR